MVNGDEALLELSLAADARAGMCYAILREDQWTILRDIRLIALKDSPDSFLSTYDKEFDYDETRWRSEFSRGEWIIAKQDGHVVAIVGAVSGYDVPDNDRYLEYLWVSPEVRGSGVAPSLIQTVLRRLKAAEIGTVWLWILDGNDPARKLYDKCGFTSTGKRQPLPNSTICEERMNMALNSIKATDER